ncbi:MAG: hypothetical protein JRJ20_16200 [Deltaproteobacteria bacterium]|nr:hypothetical protein [Deltaproteobacteria bacterium]
MSRKTIARELFIIIGFAVITALTVNYFSPHGIAFFGEWDIARGVITAKSKGDMIVREREIKDIIAGKQTFDSGTTKRPA